MAKELRVYTLEEVAALLHLTRRTLYSYVREGKLKAAKVGRFWRIPERNLEEFLNTGAEVADGNRYHGTR